MVQSSRHSQGFSEKNRLTNKNQLNIPYFRISEDIFIVYIVEYL